MRFSAAPAGPLGDRTRPWTIFGERRETPDGLEDSALAGAVLAPIASTPGAPMFATESLFGAHMAAQSVAMSEDAPAIVFVHGFGYEPRRPVLARAQSDNAHRTIYHFDETPDGPGSVEERRLHTTPWFARAMLPDGSGRPEDCRGLAVGFCYASRGDSADPLLPGRLARLGQRVFPRARSALPASFAIAHADARIAGHGLAATLSQLRVRLDRAGLREKPVDIFCHSLGARVVMSALTLLARRWPGDSALPGIGNVLVLGGACHWSQAADVLATLAMAGLPRQPEFYNVTFRGDNLLRFLAGRAIPHSAANAARNQAADPAEPSCPAGDMAGRGRLIGLHGGPPGGPRAGWVDIPLESLRRRRLPLTGDHWSYLTAPGNWAFYRSVLHRRVSLPRHVPAD